MRRTSIVLVVVGLAAAGALATPALAGSPTWPATFRGLTQPQLLPAQFEIVQRGDSSLAIRGFDVEIDISCPSGEGFEAGFGGFWRPALPLDGRRLSIHEIWDNVAFGLDLRVTPTKVRGTFDFALAAFTPDEALQRCDSGLQTFAAERVPTTVASVASARSTPLDLQQSTLVHNGQLTITRSFGGSLAASDARYRGKTSQRLPIDFGVHRRHSGVRELTDADFMLESVCDDGSSGGTWGIGMGWFGGGPPIRDGSFAIDDVGFDSALHWSGHVGNVRAHGSLRFAVPAFTQDEQLQVCGSGALTWRAHAVDA